jgi:hypothetical protein
MIVGRGWPFRRGCAGGSGFRADRGSAARFGWWRWLLQDRRSAQRIPWPRSRAPRRRTIVDGRDPAVAAPGAPGRRRRTGRASPLCRRDHYAASREGMRVDLAIGVSEGWRDDHRKVCGRLADTPSDRASASGPWSGVTPGRHLGRRRVVIFRFWVGSAWFRRRFGHRSAAPLSDGCTTASMRIRDERLWCGIAASSD